MATLERALERSGVPMEDGTARLRAVRTSGYWYQYTIVSATSPETTGFMIRETV